MTAEPKRVAFHMDLPADLVALSDDFKQAGHELYVVGGAVRDALMGKQPKDYDVATDASPDEVEHFLSKDPTLKLLPIGKAFGVVKVLTPEGGEYEIATFRKDIGKGRRPDAVEFTSIANDVLRRDLTINALFYDIDKQQIVDYVGGIDDIKRKVVRAVGDAVQRFDEDRLRILRALRFAARMGSDLDPTTAAAIKADNSLRGVSPERIRDEFLKCIKSAQSVPRFLEMMTEYDMWSQVLPGLLIDDSPVDSRNVPVLLACLLIDNVPERASKRLNALKYSSEEVAQVSFLLRFKDLDVDNAYRLRKAYANSKLNNEDLIEFTFLSGYPAPRGLLNAFLHYRLSVSGNDLLAQGFSGAQLGRELERQETVRFRQLYDKH